MAKKKDNKTELSFEKALKQLENTVTQLEEGDLSLDDSLQKYEKGIKLARECRTRLEEAKKKIELLLKEDGDFRKEPFETDIG